MDSRSKASDGRAVVGAGQLHTPETPTQHSFNEEKATEGNVQLVSPESKDGDKFTDAGDEPLFAESTSRQSSSPLFPNNDSSDIDAAVAEVESASAEDRRITPFSFSAFLSGQQLHRVPGTTIRIEPTLAAGKAYVKDRMAENERFAAARRELERQLPRPHKSVAAPRERIDILQLDKVNRTAAIAKLPAASPRKPAAKSTVAKASSSGDACQAVTPETPERKVKVKAKAKARPTRATKARSVSAPLDDAEGKGKYTRQPPSKKAAPKEQDETWPTMDNYAPPADTALGDRLWPDSLMPDSKTVFEPEGMVDYEHLAPIERPFVKYIRIAPRSYLANKRRIFQAKVNHLRAIKAKIPETKATFTKTVAQGMCNIDVNKTSRMFEAYTKAGWFDDDWFSQYL